MKSIFQNFFVLALIFNEYNSWVIGKDFVQMFIMFYSLLKAEKNGCSIIYFIVFFFSFLASEFQCYGCSSDILETCSITSLSNDTDLPIQSCSPLVTSCFLKIESN